MTINCLLTTIGDDPHNQGLFRVWRMAHKAGINCHVLPPGPSDEEILAHIERLDPLFIGFSYRLSPEVGVREMTRLLELLHREGLLKQKQREVKRKIALAGLPETMRAMKERQHSLPCEIWTMPQDDDRIRGANRVLTFLEITDPLREQIIDDLRSELFPPGISVLDELAREVLASDAYKEEPPLPIPSKAAQRSYIQRIRESTMPLLRTHFGIPHHTIRPTVEGINRLAQERVIDEVSLGSSDLSQRFFGKPEEFVKRKNDGGVPYQTAADLSELFEATRRGNYPSIKPYAHVVELVDFIDICLQTGMLIGAHQAVPLYWFNELDGRGPMTVPESIREHIAAVRKLARCGIPVEMNDPNQWSSRWAHDTIICADYALITAVMLASNVQDLVLQMQFNKPRETGDFADIAKMMAGLELAQSLASASAHKPQIWRETRTGIDYFDPSPQIAKYQLARSTLLQMILQPHIIHLVSYCEADHIATADDVIDSSKLVRRAVRIFGQHAPDLLRYREHPVVVQRRVHLLEQSQYLLRKIAQLNDSKLDMNQALSSLVPHLASPHALSAALEQGYMSAPGIFHPRYQARKFTSTGPTKYGFIDCFNPKTGEILTELERLNLLAENAQNLP
jgi:hypothetical protein